MRTLTAAILAALLVSCGRPAGEDTVNDALYGFENIQDSCRTKVWWFHGETVTTREGITADLEAYKAAGVGGVVYYDQTHGVKESEIKALSPQWWELLKFASQECNRLGLTFETHISNGYVAGGPWITPGYAMQELISADTIVAGGRKIELRLPEVKKRYDFSRDVAVLAFPSVGAEEEYTLLPGMKKFADTGKVTVDFGKEICVRGVSYDMRPRGKAKTSSMQVPGKTASFAGTGYYELPPIGELEVSDNGRDYSVVCSLKPVYQALGGTNRMTLAFPAVSGRYFRLNLHDWATSKDRIAELELGNVELTSRAMIDQWEEKAARRAAYIEGDDTPAYTAAEVIRSSDIVNLTANTDSLGNLSWDAPEGNWKIVRFAHVPNGGHTKHGRPEMNALECDKMSAEALRYHWDSYLGRIVDTLRCNGGRIDGFVVDSHEAGPQNWTSGFEKEFERMRGYDIVEYLPVLAGYVVDSPQFSDRLLYDFRRSIADLTVERYFSTFAQLGKENGLRSTVQDFGAICYAADPVMTKGAADKPQGEFWTHHPDGNYDIKEVSSAAHLYGKKVASAEAFTDISYKMTPSDMKWLSDYAYCFGINEFVVCASSHQPWLDRFPGCTGGGRQYAFDRCNPYWDFFKPGMESQARTAWLMRQGKPVVDFCVYLGDNAPVRIVSHKLPDIPRGFDFDAATTDALVNQLSVRGNKVTAPSGVEYSVILLPEKEPLTLPALQAIHRLVKAGAVVSGRKPAMSPSQTDMDRTDEYERLAADLWQGGELTEFGKGRVYCGLTPQEVIEAEQLTADLDMPEEARLMYIHRSLADGDIYFIANRAKEAFEGGLKFRVNGGDIEMWKPAGGTRYDLSAKKVDGKATSVDMQLAPGESVAVVFGKDKIPGEALPNLGLEKVTAVAGPWKVHFDERLGGPGDVEFASLTDWTANEDDRIKYYSGRAVYSTVVKLEDSGAARLELEPFNGAAKVRVNGTEAGIVWCSPWSVDISGLVKAGENEIEIEVANSALNRMVKDASLPQEERVTYSSTPVVKPDDRLLPSGLKGEVRILQ